MARGTPDGRLSDFSYASQIPDSMQVANSLWGFSSVDGQGRPIYFDTFNNGLGGWQKLLSGSGQLPILNGSAANGEIFSPPFCVQLRPGIVNIDQSMLKRVSYLNVNTRLGMEAGVFINGSTCDYVIGIEYKPPGFPGGFGALRFNHTAQAWQYWNPIGWNSFYTVGSSAMNVLNGISMQVKFVADFSTGKYIRALIGDQLFDLSAISLAINTNPTGVCIATCRGDSYGAGTTDGFLGYALFTRDEP